MRGLDKAFQAQPPPPWIEDGWRLSVLRAWTQLDRAPFREREQGYLAYAAVAGSLVWFLHLFDGVDWLRVFLRGWQQFAETVVAALQSDFSLEPWLRYWEERARTEGWDWPEDTAEEAEEGELLPEGAPLVRKNARNHRAQFTASVLGDLALLWRERCRLARCRWGHYFFATSKLGRVPQVCPLHWPLWNQERVRRQRAGLSTRRKVGTNLAPVVAQKGATGRNNAKRRKG